MTNITETKNEKKGEWVSVRKYSEIIGKSRGQIYLDIRLGKIKSENVREAVFLNDSDQSQKITRKQIFIENL